MAGFGFDVYVEDLALIFEFAKTTTLMPSSYEVNDILLRDLVFTQLSRYRSVIF